MNRRRNPAWGWAPVVLALIVLGTLSRAPMPPGAPAGRMFPRVPAPPPSWPVALHTLGVGSVRWYLVVLLTPIMIVAARRINWSAHGRMGMAGIWAAALATLVLVSSVVEYSVVYSGAVSRPSFGLAALASLPAQFAAWIAVLLGVTAIEVRRRANELRDEGRELRAVVAEQRLVALTRQLEPHFLFNTLQNISTLIHRDAAAADQMLGKLSDLLRDLLRHRDRVMISLNDEIKYSRTYLDLCRLRFGERLSTCITVSDDLQDAIVPLFLLQPLIENALAHGVSAVDRPARIDITVARHENRLVIDVADDGVGYDPRQVRREGSGLVNVRKRLEAAFGSDQHLSIAARRPTGTLVHLDMPLRGAATL